MKEYKRLTISGLNIVEHFKKIKPENRNKFCLECFSRLAELEDKIEDGTLIELPCKVGDTVYCIALCSGGRFIRSILIRTIYDIFDLWDYFCNKTIFLTKAEAEAKLKELRGE